jgi:MarR family transcriptional regulator, organic hydroperoxide resistance regulator
MDPHTSEDRLDLDVLDAVAGLFARLLAESDNLARDYGVPTFVIKALHMIDCPLAMKELGQRMRCDPSFVTSVADMLEKRGLAARESDPGDRRVKRVVLTPAGGELRHKLECDMAARMPWRAALSADERITLLGLLHKMTAPLSASEDAACPAEEVSKDLLAAATATLSSPSSAHPGHR